MEGRRDYVKLHDRGGSTSQLRPPSLLNLVEEGRIHRREFSKFRMRKEMFRLTHHGSRSADLHVKTVEIKMRNDAQRLGF